MLNPQSWRSPFSEELTPLQCLPRFRETDLLACERPENVQRSTNTHLQELFSQGYTVLPGAIPASVCDKLAALIDPSTAFENPHDLWVEYDDPEKGRIYGVPLSQQVVERSQCRYRGMDLYRNQEAAIEACFAPALRELLIRALNSEVLAYQQLAFTYGSQQALHQDPMYVRVSRPLKLIASWIALEDVQPDSGELIVVPASHTLRQLRFDSSNDIQCQHIFSGGERSLWWNNHDDLSHRNRLNELQQLAEVLGSHIYRPSKGDVLIWSSQLIHSSPFCSTSERLHSIPFFHSVLFLLVSVGSLASLFFCGCPVLLVLWFFLVLVGPFRFFGSLCSVWFFGSLRSPWFRASVLPALICSFGDIGKLFIHSRYSK